MMAYRRSCIIISRRQHHIRRGSRIARYRRYSSVYLYAMTVTQQHQSPEESVTFAGVSVADEMNTASPSRAMLRRVVTRYAEHCAYAVGEPSAPDIPRQGLSVESRYCDIMPLVVAWRGRHLSAPRRLLGYGVVSQTHNRVLTF